MQMGFEAGLAFGQALTQIRDHEARLAKVEREVATVKTLAIRGALLLLLWGGGLALNLPADKVGEAAASLLQALSKR